MVLQATIRTGFLKLIGSNDNLFVYKVLYMFV